MPNLVAHPAHEAIASLGDDDLEPRPARPLFDQLDDRGSGRPVLERDAFAQTAERLHGRPAPNFDLVHLRHVIAGVEKAMAQLSVRGHQEQAFGVVVESPHRQEPVRFARDEVRHGLPVLRVRKGRDHFDRLVQHERRRGLPGADAYAVDRHVVFVGVRFGAQGLNDLAVHRDPTVFDERLRFTAGGKASSR